MSAVITAFAHNMASTLIGDDKTNVEAYTDAYDVAQGRGSRDMVGVLAGIDRIAEKNGFARLFGNDSISFFEV